VKESARVGQEMALAMVGQEMALAMVGQEMALARVPAAGLGMAYLSPCRSGALAQDNSQCSSDLHSNSRANWPTGYLSPGHLGGQGP